jgi:hypothetical protein
VKREWNLREVRADGSAKTFVYETQEQRDRRDRVVTWLFTAVMLIAFAVPWVILLWKIME